MAAALFDLDQFGKINESHGPLMGDRILFQVAQVFQEIAGQTDLVARFSGQRFLMLMVNSGPRAATKQAELARLSIDRISFRHGKEAIHLTASAGLTVLSPEDSMETLFARLEATVAWAKGAGPNLGAFHDGKVTEPISLPNLKAEYREITLES
jgi:diguanylate cyclase (GGDEF)-like protein